MQTRVDIFNDNGTLLNTSYQEYIPTVIDKFTSISSTDFQSLIASSSLSPGNYYKITNLSGWAVYLMSVTPNTVNPIGFGVELSTGTKAEIEYDITSNQLVRVYDLSYHNWIEGNTNISNFVWGNSIFERNIIKNGSTLILASPVSSFKNNIIKDNSTLEVKSTSSIGHVDNNTISSSIVTLGNCNLHDFSFNEVNNSNIEFKVNDLGNSGIINNEFSDVVTPMYLEGTIPLFQYNKFTKDSRIYTSIGSGVTIFASITNNNLDSSQVDLTGCDFNIFERNNIIGSQISITTSLGTSGFYSNNSITNCQGLTLTYNTVITNCTMTDVRAGALLDTAEVYGDCVYNNGESTFYATYDFSSPSVYTAATNTMTVQSGHEYIIGIFVINNYTYLDTIDTIVNYPSNHKFKIKSLLTQSLQIGNAGNIIFPTSLGSLYQIGIAYPYCDFVELDARNYPVGPVSTSSSGGIFLINALSY